MAKKKRSPYQRLAAQEVRRIVTMNLCDEIAVIEGKVTTRGVERVRLACVHWLKTVRELRKSGASR